MHRSTDSKSLSSISHGQIRATKCKVSKKGAAASRLINREATPPYKIIILGHNHLRLTVQISKYLYITLQTSHLNSLTL